MITGVGAAYGTAKSGIGIAGVGTYRPDLIMKVGLQMSAMLRFANMMAVSHSGRHVRYHCRLRPGYRSPNCRRHGASARKELQLVYRLYALGQWFECRLDWSGCRVCDWNSRRYGREIIHATIKDLRGNGPHPDFRRSIGSLWVDRGIDLEL